MRRNTFCDTAACGCLASSTLRETWPFSPFNPSWSGDRVHLEVRRTAGAGGGAAWAGTVMGALALVIALALLVAPRGPQASNRHTVEVVYASTAALRHVLDASDVQLVRDVPPLRLAELRPAGDPRDFIASLKRQQGIVDARLTVARSRAGNPALTLGLLSTPAGGAYEWQWYATGVDRVSSSVLAAAARMTIAVVDTGADVTAPGLAAKVKGSYDVRSGARVADDQDGHGTFVASLAAGSTAGGGGVAGFGGAARLLVVKVGDGTHVTDFDVAAGIVYAVQRGARVVNVSIAGKTRSAAEASAVAYAARRGALVVAAVGNDAQAGNPAEYPAALLESEGSNGVGSVGLAVGASDMQGHRAAFSEHGAFVSLAAPGTAVFGAVSRNAQVSAFPRVSIPGISNGSYGFASGTSYAAPQVSGAAALVWAVNPRLSSREVATILKQTASGGGVWTPDLGFGVINVAAAVDAAARTTQ